MSLDFNAAVNGGGDNPKDVEVLDKIEQDASTEVQEYDPFDLEPVKVLFDEYDERIQGLVDEATALKVEDAESNNNAVAMMAAVQKLKKRIDTVRKEKTKPYFDFKKGVDSIAKGFVGRLDTVLKALNPKVTRYQQEQERIRREEERKAQEEADRLAKKAEEERRKLQEAADKEAAEKGEEAPVIEAPAVAAPVIPKKDNVTRTEQGAAHIRKEWVFEVEDPSKVPAEYLMVDERAVRAAVKNGVR